MSADKLPPVPFQAPMTNQMGRPTPVWADWFKQLFHRVGESTSYTPGELKALIDSLENTIAETTPLLVQTGMIIDFGGTTAPSGYLFCDGSAVSRTSYSVLFGVIGTTYGTGDGSTTFNLPPGGRAYFGKKSGGTFATLGSTGGAETASLPNHDHPYSGTTGTPSATTTAVTGAGTTLPTSVHTHGFSGSTGNPSSNPSIAILPPWAVTNKIIKT